MFSNSSRQKIPFGIAQIGKAFENDLTPGNFIFRTREFEQMEMQYFVHPSREADRWFEYWKLDQRRRLYGELGLRPGAPAPPPAHARRARPLRAARRTDIQYEFPFGWHELEGIHNRGDFDLSRHEQFSGKKLSYSTRLPRERFIRSVVDSRRGAATARS